MNENKDDLASRLAALEKKLGEVELSQREVTQFLGSFALAVVTVADRTSPLDAGTVKKAFRAAVTVIPAEGGQSRSLKASLMKALAE